VSRTTAGLVDSRQHLDQRRLAGAVFAEQRVDLALAHVEIDAIERLQSEKALADGSGAQKQVGLAHGVLHARLRRIEAAVMSGGKPAGRSLRPTGSGEDA
jgi:hypothetical protein